MAKVTANYEVVYIMDPAIGEEKIAALNERFQNLIGENGTVVEVDEWGKRRLAYPINYITDGYYVLVKFTSAPDFPAELERILRNTETVMRSLVTLRYE